MKKFAVAALIGALSFAAPALGADLGVILQPAPAAFMAPSGYNWSGFYAGLNGGYGFAELETDIGTLEDIDGVFGGAQVGYNYDFGGFVLGVEGDVQISDIEYEESAFGLTANIGIDYFGTVRARAGYAFDRVLPYVTGGLAWANGSASLTDGVSTISGDENYVGYAVGGGVEFAATDAITLKAEYLYADFGDRDLGGGLNTNLTAHIVRAGVNFKF